jgi:hypothetical protein
VAHELNIEQTREIVRLRHRHPRAEVVVHHKRWGIIVEARRRGQMLELERFDWTGAVTADQRIRTRRRRHEPDHGL